MEWAFAIAFGAMVLICPLMMIGMMVGGWLFGRRSGGSVHSGHGMMMCHGMHGSREGDSPSVDELKAERDRLDREISESERRLTTGDVHG